jgi:hypothetical protein
LVFSSTNASALTSTSRVNRLGNETGFNFFGGLLDDVRIYNRTLSQAEITRLYQGSPRTSDGTITLQGNLSLSNNLTLATSTLDARSRTLTVSGTFSNDGLLLLNGNETVTATNDTDSGEIRYQGSSSYSSLPLGNTYYDLSFYGQGTFNPHAALTVNGSLFLSGSTLDTRWRNLSITGNLNNSGGGPGVIRHGFDNRDI